MNVYVYSVRNFDFQFAYVEHSIMFCIELVSCQRAVSLSLSLLGSLFSSVRSKALSFWCVCVLCGPLLPHQRAGHCHDRHCAQWLCGRE